MIMRLTVFILLITSFLSLNLKSEKVCDLDEVLKLEQLFIDNDHAYITEDFIIYIYSIKKKNLVRSFGKKGEGPGEFISMRNFIIGDKTISIDSQNKILFFSKEGKFINEIRKDPNCNKLVPIKKNYAGFKLDFSVKDINKVLIYNIYDSNFKKIKTIGNNAYIGKLLKRIRQPGKYDDHIPRVKKSFIVNNNKIYIGDPEKGIHFEVYNHKGEFIKTIFNDHKKEKMTTKFKSDYINELKQSNNWEKTKARKNIIFENFFHSYEWFLINNKYIYLFTYKIKDDKRQCIIIDMNGNIIKETSVKNVNQNLLSVNKNYFYYALENEEDEIWELHRQEIFE